MQLKCTVLSALLHSWGRQNFPFEVHSGLTYEDSLDLDEGIDLQIR